MPEAPNIFDIFSFMMYGVLALVALWGAYCAVMVWRRVATARFRSEQQQEAFLDEVESRLKAKDFAGVEGICQGDRRAMPQLVLLAIEKRDLGVSKVQKLIVDRFQRDILADLEHRLSWVNTVIKTAPMVGLLGTVMG
ncbi:MAG: MotA/TolQ/ExbB proton channel family protein, partial [bacterium]|nr:MotA/TolQ/ExbB proton channel family protein [bacterium]